MNEFHGVGIIAGLLYQSYGAKFIERAALLLIGKNESAFSIPRTR